MENRDLTRPTIGRDYRVNTAMIKLHAYCCGLLIALGLFGDLTGAQAQMPLSAMAPQALVPGKTIRVEFTGNQFKTPLRVASSIPIEAQWISVEPTKAIGSASLFRYSLMISRASVTTARIITVLNPKSSLFLARLMAKVMRPKATSIKST